MKPGAGTRMGWGAIVNDLHKGRDSGDVWKAIIDISAILMCLVSTQTYNEMVDPGVRPMDSVRQSIEPGAERTHTGVDT